MLTVCAFKWSRPGYRSEFTSACVNIDYAMWRRNFHKPFRYVCITDDPTGLRPEVETFPIWDDWADVPSPHGASSPACYRRLKLFHPETARAVAGPDSDTILWKDLDNVICGDVTPAFDRPEPLVLLATGAVSAPYNGSLVLMKVGCRPDLWEEFTPAAGVKAKEAGFVGSDQGYLAWKLRNEKPATWVYGSKYGIYRRRDLTLKNSGAPPADACMVIFMGKPDPWEPAAVRRWPWIRYHYAEELLEETRAMLEGEIIAHAAEQTRRLRSLYLNRPIRSEEISHAYRVRDRQD